MTIGAGAAFHEGCVKSGLDLPRRAICRLSRAGDDRVASQRGRAALGNREFKRNYGRPIWWMNMSGGTDVAANFVGANRELPQVPGRMQCRQLGSATKAWDENGRSLIDEVGDLVCTKPLPSMPLYFWGDMDNTRYLDSYFREFPGVWRHGDWISIGKDGSCVIYGRSDATLNRSGLRMGTSEIYGAVEMLPGDSGFDGHRSRISRTAQSYGIFVVLRADATLTSASRIAFDRQFARHCRPIPTRPDFSGACDPAHAVWQKAGSAYQEALSRPFRRGRRQS